jgi:polyisoprenoid-binding protein YceI
VTDISTTPSTPPTRTVKDTDVPAAGTWTLDTAHSAVAFTGRHLMVTKVRGNLPVLDGAITIAEDPAQSSVQVTIDLAGIESGSPDRDGHLRSADFFDTENHPTATFTSTKLDWNGGDEAKLEGDLTIKGVTHPVVLDVEYGGVATDPWGGTRTGFSASAEVNREDWGLGWNVALEAGGVLVSKKIKLEIEVEAVRS